MAKKPKPKKVFWKNKQSGCHWKAEPYFAYKVTNLDSKTEYVMTPEELESKMDSDNVEIIDSKAFEVLYG